ncbi:Bax inhibitor family protein [Trametes versicolor FP-101664 SS1]|uniref:Bax inhibitor family protein n=1 Tax=Trametes versicolor (strain FP-101664) TaxID=717944 RepID=UPI0004621453|nr:Bax inhibitor family protein [Trametes versicolor FP-101664 SS1]EIW64207.1 Bax inhibitor family protein [Trametes versicolor FP-101664 SS1]
MLRIGFVSAARPLASSAFSQAARNPQMASFRLYSSLRPNVLGSFKRSPLSPSFFTRQSRTFITDANPVVYKPSQAESWKRFGITAATVAGTIVGVNVFLNRETRDGLSAAEQSYLHQSFQYTGGGLAITAIVARTLFKNGFAFRLMSANPWVVLGVSLVGSIGTMMGAMYTPPENTVLKHAFWLGFNACQAATLSPLFFFSPAILSRAALYTCGVVGSLSYVGATAKNDTYLYMGGPLLAGVTVVALSSLAPMALPLGMRGLAITEAISLYGGLAVFSGFVLYDTQKILRNARLAEAGKIANDPLKESIALQLDMINIFIRMVQILAQQQSRK